MSPRTPETPSALTVEVSEQTAVIKLMGEVSIYNADYFRDAIDGQLGSPDIDTVAIDLSQTEGIDSTGLGVLVGSLMQAQDAEKSLVLRNPSAYVTKMLEISGLSETFEIEIPPQKQSEHDRQRARTVQRMGQMMATRSAQPRPNPISMRHRY